MVETAKNPDKAKSASGDVPVGNDIMVATPTGQGLSDKVAVQQRQQEEGRSTISDKDRELLKSKVENRVKELQLAGLTKDEIIRAAGAIDPGNAALAQEMASAQLAPQDFNLFAGMANGTQRFAVQDMGSNTAAIALVGLAGGFTNQAPDVRAPDTSRGVTT